MPMFKPISENDAKGKVKEIYDEIKSVRQISEVPNFWKSLANNPETLERTWTSLKQVMKKGARVFCGRRCEDDTTIAGVISGGMIRCGGNCNM